MISAKYASLLAGLLQQSALVLITRYSKTQHEASDVVYLTSVAVASAELFKMTLSYVLEVSSVWKTTDDSARLPKRLSNASTTDDDVNENWFTITKRMVNLFNRESVKVVVPAVLYLVQNNLFFVALSNLSVPMYQVTNQGKLLTTAIISRIMLKKEISGMQYFAISLLGLGVAVIHLSEYHSSKSTSGVEDDELQHQNQILGLLAVLASCFTSGFSGVYFELILKTSEVKQSLNVRNFQLALWSLLFGSFFIVYKDGAKIRENGLFQGFDWIVILVVVAQGMTGFVVSLILKYADAVLKGFAISLAAVLSTFASVVFFGTKINATFLLGASMVLCAVKLYSYKSDADGTTKTSLTIFQKTVSSTKTFASFQVLKISVLVGLLVLYHANSPDLRQFHNVYSVKTLTEQCPLRNLSDYSASSIGDVHKVLPTKMEEANCLYYDCTYDHKTTNECDSTLPTNYDGPNPPCCTHILRDMARTFDDHMCSLGLDYSVAFGTLLGYRRSDRLVPWTLDNDFIIPSKDTANAMVKLWDSSMTGMAHIFQGINRMCVTPDFAGGVLKEKWGRDTTPKNHSNIDFSGLVYIDFYVGKNVTGKVRDALPDRNNGTTPKEVYATIGECRHMHSDIFPTKRELVYNRTFAQRFPLNSEQLLREKYGPDWRIPPSKKSGHGHGTPCDLSYLKKKKRNRR